MKSIILSCSGLTLTDDEKRFFAEANPFGFILFKRNIDNPDQLRALVKDLRASVGRECPILIDQEGGRVQRMTEPNWGKCKSARDHESVEEVRATTRAIARDLNDVGIDVDCAPVLDVLCPDTHDAIGNRAYSDDPADVAAKGLAACEEFLAAGITPVIKHIPGQGRASVDSHYDLPVVDVEIELLSRCDFMPFRAVSQSELSDGMWGMIAHVIYKAIDPDLPATVSRKIIDTIRSDIEFNGLLLSDDVSMGALNFLGNPADRTAKMLESGIDIGLYCAGHLTEMQEIAAIAPPMSEAALERYERSRTAKALRGRSAA
jgi:beta-N-acetylhexosaminidase